MEPDHPGESYYDTFHGRGQDEQDQRDLDEGLVELEDLCPESAVRSMSPPRIEVTPVSGSATPLTSETQPEDPLVAHLVTKFPGLTREEAVRHLEAFGG